MQWFQQGSMNEKTEIGKWDRHLFGYLSPFVKRRRWNLSVETIVQQTTSQGQVLQCYAFIRFLLALAF